jgi:hypothetical protein
MGGTLEPSFWYHFRLQKMIGFWEHLVKFILQFKNVYSTITEHLMIHCPVDIKLPIASVESLCFARLEDNDYKIVTMVTRRFCQEPFVTTARMQDCVNRGIMQFIWYVIYTHPTLHNKTWILVNVPIYHQDVINTVATDPKMWVDAETLKLIAPKITQAAYKYLQFRLQHAKKPKE